MFRNFVNSFKEASNYLNMIYNYVKSSFDSFTLYQDRAEVLFPISKLTKDIDIDIDIVDCRYKIIELLDKIFEEVTLVEKTEICGLCNSKYKNIKYQAVTFSRKTNIEEIIIKSGLEKLQDCLDLHFNPVSKSKCLTCISQPFLKKVFKIKTVLVIWTENLFLDYKIKDTEIPDKVSVFNKEYHLVGFISYRGVKNELGHYITYIKTENNKWEERDGFNSNINILNQYPKNIKIALIFFVEKNSAQRNTSQIIHSVPKTDQLLKTAGNKKS